MGGISRSVDAALPAGPRSWPAGPGALRLKPPLFTAAHQDRRHDRRPHPAPRLPHPRL